MSGPEVQSSVPRIAGRPSQTRPASSRPLAFLSRRTPSGPQLPHCLKKKATPAAAQRSRTDKAHSGRIGRASGPELAADDDPADAAQVERPQVLQQWFHRPEADAGGHLAKKVDARQSIPAILHRDTEPDVARDGSGREELEQPLGALGQNWIGVPGRLADRRQHPVDKIIGHLRVEQVDHRADEIHGRLVASERRVEAIRVQGQVEAPRVAGRPHRVQPTRHPLGVAVLATRRHFGAAGDRVPSRFGPLDAAFLRHGRNHARKPALRLLSKFNLIG